MNYEKTDIQKKIVIRNVISSQAKQMYKEITPFGYVYLKD